MRIIFLTYCLLVTKIHCSAQALEKLVTINCHEEAVENILHDLHNRYHINFSYADAVVHHLHPVSLHEERERMKVVLDKILNATAISYEERGNVILLKKKEPIETKTSVSKQAREIITEPIGLNVGLKEPKHLFSDSITYIVNKNDTLTKPLFKTSTGYLRLPVKQKWKHTLTLPLVKYNSGNAIHTQIALFFNRANRVIGSQIGLINVANDISGVQIGLINVCRNGYRKMEIWTSSTLDGNFAFKTGTRKLYSIFTMGLNSDKDLDQYNWGLGYGWGTEIKLTKQWSINADALIYQIGADLKKLPNKFNLMEQLKIDCSYAINSKISFFMGPEFNMHYIQFYSTDGDQDNDDTSSSPNPTSYLTQHTHHRITIGLNGGIRF